MPASCTVTLIAAATLVGGCESTARFDLVAPGAARGEIAQNAGAIIPRDKIDYEIFQAQDKVIVRLVNRTGGPLTLTDASTVIDVSGRTFAVDAQSIEPDQAGRIVVPPAFAVDRARSTPVATEVRVGGVDEGGIIGSRRAIELNDAGGATTGSAAPAAGFRWPSNGLVRLRLVYRVGAGGDELTHDWSFRRSK